MITLIPTKTLSVLATMLQAMIALRQDNEAENRLISERFFAFFGVQLENLNTAETRVADNQRDWRNLNRDTKETKGKLERTLRNFWAIARMQQVREDMPQTVLAIYRIPNQTPKSFTLAELAVHALAIIEGEPVALEMGLAKINVPSTEEITELYLALEDLRERELVARKNLQESRKQRLTMATNGRRALRGLSRRLREALQDEDPVTTRQIMRRFALDFATVKATDDVQEPPTTTHPAENPNL